MHPVALGTNTDPYQRAEGRYRLMPGIIAALADIRHAVHHPDQGHAAAPRSAAAGGGGQHVPVDLSMSIAVYDDELQQSVEPGTPTARRGWRR